MKKNFLIATALLITLGACTNDDSAPKQNEISFKAINYKNTRTSIDGPVYPTNVPFGVFAYYLSGGDWASNYGTAATYMNNLQVQNDGGVFKTTNKYYWPNKGTLTFVAYSPKSAPASYAVGSRTLTITGYSCEDVEGGNFADQADLMYSNAGDAKDKSYDGSSVSITFRHALSQIRFYAKPAEASSTTQFNVLKVVLKNIQNKGSLNVVNGDISSVGNGWTISTEESAVKEDFTVYDNATGVALDMIDPVGYIKIGVADDNANNLLVLPQDFGTSSTCAIEVTYKMWVGAIDAGDKAKSVLVKDIISKFEPNKIYKMNFSISADEITFAPTVMDWDEPAIEGTNGELE